MISQEKQPKIGIGIRTIATIGALGALLAFQQGESRSSHQDAVNEIALLEDQLQVTAEDNARLRDRLEQIEVAANPNVDSSVVAGDYLAQPEELPGFGMEVAEDQRELLAQATIKIVTRPKGSNQAWSENCTGVKISDGSDVYIISAAHCFWGDVAAAGKGGTDIASYDISEISVNEYAIIDANDTDPNRTISPIANVNDVSVLTGSDDIALLRISNPSEDFQSLPAVTFDTLEPPLQGAEVAVYGAPESNDHMPVSTTGTYLGRIVDPYYGAGRYIDLVGISADSPDNDACNYGASGSAAMGANEYVFGPLTTRNNISFGRPDTAQNGPDDPDVGIYYRLDYESRLGIDLMGYDTVCGYSVNTSENLPTLVRGLDTSLQLP